MRHNITLFILLLMLIPKFVLSAQPVDSVTSLTPPKQPQSVGLVLSGGGAKGIAHIGVIQALEDNDIPIDYITGTSMGAIVGGLYACGYTPAEMMEVIMSKPFSYWSTGQIDRSLTYYALREEAEPALLTLNLAGRDSISAGPILPVSIISPLPMNFGFMELFSPYTAQCGGNFNHLFVPFRCITSDVTHKRKIVCGSGSVGDAIRASMNFPVVFHPIYRNGAMLYDGGIYENYPIATMRQVFAPDIMIGVDVSSGNEKPSSTEDIVDQLETMIIQGGVQQMPENLGVGLKIDLERFGLLDFTAAPAIYKIGYDYAMAHMDSIKARITSRIDGNARRLRREVFKSQTPALVFSDSVKVTGGSPSQNRLIESFFRPRHAVDSALSVDDVRRDYYRTITPGKISNLVPQAVYNAGTGLFDLNLRATLKNRFNLGIGAYVSTSTSSMLFFSGTYSTLSYNSLSLGMKAWVGQSYQAAVLRGSVALRGRNPSSVTLEVVGSRHKFSQSEHLFYQFSQPTFVTHDELFARAYFTTAMGLPWKLEAGIGAGHLVDRYFTDFATEYESRQRDNASRNLFRIFVKAARSTLDSDQFPISGALYNVVAMGVTGRSKTNAASVGDPIAGSSCTRSFLQAEFRSRNYWLIGRHLALGLESDIVASTHHLPYDYYTAIVQAPAFRPTSSSYSVFDAELRANSYLAAGFVPVWRFNSMLQARGTFWAFAPLRGIRMEQDGSASYGPWLHNVRFLGELAAVMQFQRVSISVYGRYTSTDAGRWGGGISFGLFFLAPRFLR